KEFIGKHRDRLLEFLEYYKSPYIETEAISTLGKIAVEPEHYKVVLPAMLEKTTAFRVDSASYRSSTVIANALKSASPEVKKFADPLVKVAYKSVPGVLKEPNTGAIMNRGAKTVRSRIGSIVKTVPGGEEFVRRIPKTTLKSYISGNPSDMYAYSGKFTPNDKMVGTWAWAVWPTPNNPSEIDERINAFIKGHKGKPPEKIAKPKDTLKLEKGGKVSKSGFYRGYFWSGDMLIGVDDDQALKMEIRTVAGRDFLIVERGGFNAVPKTEEEATADIPKDYHCGFHVYMRE
ncbi:MAG: hypothetical protein ACPG4K_04625, partial [Haloferula sp.]